MPTLIDFESNEQRAVTTVLGECRQGCNEASLLTMLAVSPCFLCGFRGKTDLHPLSAPLMTTKMVPLMVLPPAPPSVTASSSGHGTDTFPSDRPSAPFVVCTGGERRTGN